MAQTRVRSLVLVIGALLTVVSVSWWSAPAAMVHLLASTVLAMGGTEHPLVGPDGRLAEDRAFVDGYVSGAISRYVSPTSHTRPGGTAEDPYAGVAVHSPEEFFPVFGTMTFDDSTAAGVTNLDHCVEGRAGCRSVTMSGERVDGAPIIIFGYSQSARVATLEKRDLIERYDGTKSAPNVSFVLIGNPNRPNGGILQRFEGLYIPLMGVTFDGATPTDSDLDGDGIHEFPTADITRQYDGWSDFPAYPLNMVATMNAVAGIYYLHGDYFGDTVGPAVQQGEYGDTTYYIVPTERLPLLLPFEQLGVPSPILTAIDAPLRVIVEWGYDRDPAHLGIPTRARLIPRTNPVTGLVDLVVSIPTGLDDGWSEAVGDPEARPLDTDPVDSPYGVGGVAVGAPEGSSGATASTSTPEPTAAPAATAVEPAGEPSGDPEPDPALTERRRDTTAASEDDEPSSQTRNFGGGLIKRIISRATTPRTESETTSEPSPSGADPTPKDEDPPKDRDAAPAA
ncbi:PE-PPE domain-containing protein [Mycobacterium sp. PS03-16]|uniref:PE-PPE domain-containing protein n=1 Tax=Mycobacterium sp. PS03-16 TaxID=2559611 RepID=UPI00107372FE|nr:PE-PPE domain-containing protein [Mycobacterium sp. PS03-16]TFV61070.1 PE-PPE domain-containing protein [Mycobacterium sp. PS03-16]